MELKAFLSKNDVILPSLTLDLCNEGLTIMKRSTDPLHDDMHIARILGDLDCFLGKESKIDKRKIDFKTLLLAICWHDVWKSRRFPTNTVSLVFDRMIEGIGSMRVFAKKAREAGLNRELIRAVRYAIRKHSDFQIFPIKGIETRVLKDLDMLEGWSSVKLRLLKRIYLVPGKIDPRLLRLAEFYFNNFMTKTTEMTFYFDWSRTEFVRRKAFYLKEVRQLYQDYGKWL